MTSIVTIYFQLVNTSVKSLNDRTQDHQLLNKGHDEVRKP